MQIIFKKNQYDDNIEYLLKTAEFHPEITLMLKERWLEKLKKHLTADEWEELERENYINGFDSSYDLEECYMIHIVKHFPYIIYYLENVNDKLIERAIRSDSNIILDIISPTEMMQLMAVKGNGILINTFSNPSDNVKKAALIQSKYALHDDEINRMKLNEIYLRHNIKN